jgi:hypothetical protein
MEGIEGPLSRPVHVLRHRFEPTEQLAQEVAKLLERETREQKLRFFATKLAVLDGANFYNFRYDDVVTRMNESFERRTTPIGLNGKVGFKEVNHGRVRIGFQPANQSQLNMLLAGFDLEDNLRPDKTEATGYMTPDHFIYTDVAKSSVLQSDIDRKLALNSFKGTVALGATKKLFTFRPLEISGYDHTISFKPEDERIAKLARRHEPWQNQDVAS